MRLSKVTFLHDEQLLWVEEAKSEAEMKQRRKIVCKVRAEIREYIELGDIKEQSTNEIVVDSEADPVFKPSSLKYIDSFMEALKLDLPHKKLKKAKSFPCMLSSILALTIVFSAGS
jgi:hypothetical protein